MELEYGCCSLLRAERDPYNFGQNGTTCGCREVDPREMSARSETWTREKSLAYPVVSARHDM
jgi:hypothetical protein